MLANNFRLQFQDTNYFQMQDYAEMNGRGPISECKRHQRLISKIRLLNNFILHSLILNQITLHYSTLMQRRTVTAHCKPRASDVLTETLNIKRDKKWKKWNNFEKQTTTKKSKNFIPLFWDAETAKNLSLCLHTWTPSEEMVFRCWVQDHRAVGQASHLPLTLTRWKLTCFLCSSPKVLEVLQVTIFTACQGFWSMLPSEHVKFLSDFPWYSHLFQAKLMWCCCNI